LQEVFFAFYYLNKNKHLSGESRDQAEIVGRDEVPGQLKDGRAFMNGFNKFLAATFLSAPMLLTNAPHAMK
jgi:hypothetical protein